MTDFESKLREFKPRRPAAIPDERLQLLRGPVWVAVAAGLAALMFVNARLRQPKPDVRTAPPTLLELALEHPDEFDAELSRISADTLPDVTRPGGALEPLGKEF